MTRKTENMAVLFADICGSTALYEKLGDNAARFLVAACLSLTTDAVSRHRGRVVKTIGDAAMCVFQRTVDAVLGATEIQQEVSSSPPENHLLQLHMGLHCGPVLVEKGDVYGDVVNAAAYLAAMATAEQILTTNATERQLSPQHKGRVRPVFRTVVKGSAVESTVYTGCVALGRFDVDRFNLRAHKTLPGDEGSLLLAYGGAAVLVSRARCEVTIGRGPECDLVVPEKLASRKHVRVCMRRTHFYLVDQSLNGTFVILVSGDEIHVLRGDILLDGTGSILLGSSARDGGVPCAEYKRRLSVHCKVLKSRATVPNRAFSLPRTPRRLTVVSRITGSP